MLRFIIAATAAATIASPALAQSGPRLVGSGDNAVVVYDQAPGSVVGGGVVQMTGWSVNTTTGSVTFTTAPGAGVAITAGFEFDVPVRFDTDMLDVTLDLERLGSITSIPLLEIRR